MPRYLTLSLPEMCKARNRVDKSTLLTADLSVSPALANFAAGKSYFIKTYGCQANERDGEVLAGFLEKAGFKKTLVPEEADLAIINTCAVRENAEEKVYAEIGTFKANAKKKKDFILAVCGCMMQEEGVAPKIMSTYPYVNLIFGTHNVHEILQLLDQHIEEKKDLVKVLSYPGAIVEGLPSVRGNGYKASVNITYGCDKFCTYCIVPYTRGRERSRPLKDVLAECQQLVDEGYQEITLLGQNVNSYGKDFHDGTSFATVLEAVAKLGIPRLRFMTSHPWDFSLDMIDVIAKYPNIMKCIHLPVQSGSDAMLKRMGRRYTRESYLKLVAAIRDKIPDCAITTDIIVGFPNESEEEFADTLSLCEAVNYDAAFTFIYSPRKGTPAAQIKDNVSDADKHARFNRLLEVVNKSVEEHSATMLGKTYTVLVDGPSKKDKGMLSGYTEKSKMVNFKGPAYLTGEMAEVKITEDHAYSLIGELMEDPLLIKAKTLSRALQNESCVKEYFSLRAQIAADPYLAKLGKDIEETQRRLVPLAHHNQNEYLLAKASLTEMRQDYESHPLVSNLKAVHEEVEELLLTISKEIS